jgi:hypothetical protein
MRNIKFSSRKRGRYMHEEQTITEAQYWALQALVGELLVTNQKLREQVAQLMKTSQPNALATHPQPRQDH